MDTGFELPDAEKIRTQFLAGFLSEPEIPLADATPGAGRGVYALYYRGESSLYNCYGKYFTNTPIYVGKATATGARKGVASGTRSLASRLQQHSRSLEEAGFALDDFVVRVMPVGPRTELFIPMIEIIVIDSFTPLWNTVLDGFGNHAPGKGREGQAPSPWDVLHPGRACAQNLTGTPEPAARILQRIAAFVGQASQLSLL